MKTQLTPLIRISQLILLSSLLSLSLLLYGEYAKYTSESAKSSSSSSVAGGREEKETVEVEKRDARLHEEGWDENLEAFTRLSLSRSSPFYLPISVSLAPSFYTVSINRAGIRQLSSIEAAQAPQGGPPPPPPKPSRPRAGDLAVKSRLRAAHDTLNPRLVDPETFNLDVTACCQEEISLYSRDTPSPLPRGWRSGAAHSRARSRLKEATLCGWDCLKNVERHRVNKTQFAMPIRM